MSHGESNFPFKAAWPWTWEGLISFSVASLVYLNVHNGWVIYSIQYSQFFFKRPRVSSLKGRGWAFVEPGRFDWLDINYIKRYDGSWMRPESLQCLFRLLPVIRRRDMRFAMTQAFLVWRSSLSVSSLEAFCCRSLSCCRCLQQSSKRRVYQGAFKIKVANGTDRISRGQTCLLPTRYIELNGLCSGYGDIKILMLFYLLPNRHVNIALLTNER